MMDFVTDGNKNIVSFVCLFIVCLLGMMFFKMQFDSIAYDIQHEFIINNSFILNNLKNKKELSHNEKLRINNEKLILNLGCLCDSSFFSIRILEK